MTDPIYKVDRYDTLLSGLSDKPVPCTIYHYSGSDEFAIVEVTYHGKVTHQQAVQAGMPPVKGSDGRPVPPHQLVEISGPLKWEVRIDPLTIPAVVKLVRDEYETRGRDQIRSQFGTGLLTAPAAALASLGRGNGSIKRR